MATKALQKAPVPSPPKMRPEASVTSAEGLRTGAARTNRTSCVSHMRSDGSAFSYPFLSVDSLTRLEEVEEGRPEDRSEEELQATVERWTAYLHPRAKEVYDESSLEECLLCLARSVDRDPLLTRSGCSLWCGAVVGREAVCPLRLPGHPSESMTYANRMVAFLFVTDSSFEEMCQLPDLPLRMVCGNQLCVRLDHMSESEVNPAEVVQKHLDKLPFKEENQPLSDRLGSETDVGVIRPREVEQLVELSGAGEEVWETLVKDEQIHIQRHRDRSLFNGSVFVKLVGRISNTTAAHENRLKTTEVAHCFGNFADRAGWDKQMDSFRLMYNVASNDILYSLLHAPPLTDRDFLIYHATMRHESGRGIMLYTRSASNSLCPPTRAVRATQYVASYCIMQDPDGKGVTFTTTSAVDPHIPFLPKWVLTLLMPSEFRRWRNAVDKRCRELHRDAVPIPVAALLQPEDELRAPAFDKARATEATTEEATPTGKSSTEAGSTQEGHSRSDVSDVKTASGDGAESSPGTRPDSSPRIEDTVAAAPATSPGLCWCC
ncbi:unnamed protein product [Symbiodinium sp. CCMP2592]|nr:unnamed protein product [Symbiodinium sp. CCMP2592]